MLAYAKKEAMPIRRLLLLILVSLDVEILQLDSLLRLHFLQLGEIIL